MRLSTRCKGKDSLGRKLISAAACKGSRSAHAEVVDTDLGQRWLLIVDDNHHDGLSETQQEAIDYINDLMRQTALT
ncbi:MAG: hypothetical protein ACE366_16345 [Bradymonadia bacterium]